MVSKMYKKFQIMDQTESLKLIAPGPISWSAYIKSLTKSSREKFRKFVENFTCSTWSRKLIGETAAITEINSKNKIGFILSV